MFHHHSGKVIVNMPLETWVLTAMCRYKVKKIYFLCMNICYFSFAAVIQYTKSVTWYTFCPPMYNTYRIFIKLHSNAFKRIFHPMILESTRKSDIAYCTSLKTKTQPWTHVAAVWCSPRQQGLHILTVTSCPWCICTKLQQSEATNIDD